MEQAGREPGLPGGGLHRLRRGGGATPRRAEFGEDQWAVAWDRPGLPGVTGDGSPCAKCGRGVFGLAGLAVPGDPADDADRPGQRAFADGGSVAYGPAGPEPNDGEGEPLQYMGNLRLPGNQCVYQVWSYLGREHLEQLIASFRLVES